MNDLKITKDVTATQDAVGSGDWLSGIGVLGWKRVMSRQLFKTKREAQKWARDHGLKEVEYVKASMPDNVRMSHGEQ